MKAQNDRLFLKEVNAVETKSSTGLILVGTTQHVYKVVSVGPDADQALLGKLVTVDLKDALLRKLPSGEYVVVKQEAVLGELEDEVQENV